MRNILLLVTIFTVAALTGCGNGKLTTINVTGTVTYEGEPLAGATVNFIPKAEGQGHPAYGMTDAQGHYKLQTLLGNPDAGTTPGKYAVSVIKMEEQAETSDTSPSRTAIPPHPKSFIPERYGRTTTSGLTATVKKGEKNVFDFVLIK